MVHNTTEPGGGVQNLLRLHPARNGRAQQPEFPPRGGRRTNLWSHFLQRSQRHITRRGSHEDGHNTTEPKGILPWSMISACSPPHNHHGGGGITDECDNGKAIHQTPRDQPQDKKAIAAAGERRPSNSASAVASSRCWRCMTGISLCYAAPPMMSSSTLCMPA